MQIKCISEFVQNVLLHRQVFPPTTVKQTGELNQLHYIYFIL